MFGLGKPKVRTGQGSTRLTRAEFARRFKEHFYDPAFDSAQPEIERLLQIAWEAYEESRKSPRTRKAGPEFADPEHELSLEWLETRRHIHQAQKLQASSEGVSRILLICASPRSDETCPSEMSKTF